MAKKENIVIKNAADSIRKVLFNYDLELVAAQGELKLAEAKVLRYKDEQNNKSKTLWANALIDEAKLNTFIEQLTKGKNETYAALEEILSIYTPKYKKIWLMYFIGNYTYEEIAEATNYTIDGISYTIKKIKKDLIDRGLLEEEEK